MNKKLFLHSTAIMMAAMLCVSFSSCKNTSNQSENNVEKYSDVDNLVDNYDGDEFDPEDDCAPGEEGYDSYSNDSPYGNWQLGYFDDDFGEKNYSCPVIVLTLITESNKENRSGSYAIGIRVFKTNGNMGLSFHYATYPGFGDYVYAHPSPVIFRTEQGDYNIDVNVENDAAYCKNANDYSYVINLLKRGNFKIRVGSGIYNVTNETDGFVNAYNDHLMN
ncbi:MAG: hypothetical protein Q4E32_07260 [Bacteroidales bacterium]|nr:hypothetical protein [Bacteroidales bacterium]